MKLVQLVRTNNFIAMSSKKNEIIREILNPLSEEELREVLEIVIKFKAENEKAESLANLKIIIEEDADMLDRIAD